MKTKQNILDLYRKLPPAISHKAIANTRAYLTKLKASAPNYQHQVFSLQIDVLHTALDASFPFKDTPEGYAYWFDICQQSKAGTPTQMINDPIHLDLSRPYQVDVLKDEMFIDIPINTIDHEIIIKRLAKLIQGQDGPRIITLLKTKNVSGS